MMKSRTILISFFLCFMCQVEGQNFLVNGSDTVFTNLDSALLFVDDYHGEIQWYRSEDSVNWELFNIQDDSLVLGFDDEGLYKAKLSSGSCDPAESEVVKLGQQTISPSQSTFTANSLGGIFKLPGAYELILLPGAVATEQEFSLKDIDDGVFLETPRSKDTLNREYVCGFELKTGGGLLRPVLLKIPAPELIDKGDVLLLFERDTVANRWLPGSSKISYHEEDNCFYIILDPDEAQSTSSLKAEDPNPNAKNLREFYVQVYKQIFRVNNCYDIDPKLKIEEDDVVVQGNCQINREAMTTEFKYCTPPEIHRFVYELYSEECEPLEVFSPEKDVYFLKVGDTLKLEMGTYLGTTNFPLREQYIDLSSTANIKATTQNNETDPWGKFFFTIKAEDNSGFGTVTLLIHYDYHLETVYSSDGTIEEYYVYDPVKDLKPINIKVFTYDNCTKSGKLNCADIVNPECEGVKKQLINRLQLSPSYKSIRTNESFTLSAKALNHNGEEISELTPQIVLQQPEPPGVVSLSAQGGVTGLDAGTATISAEVCEETGTATVVVGDICQDGEVTVTSYPRKMRPGTSEQIQLEFSRDEFGNPIIPDLTFLSVNEDIAWVDENNIIHAYRTGETLITLFYCDKSIDLPVYVCGKEYWTVDFQRSYPCIPPEPNCGHWCMHKDITTVGSIVIDWYSGEISGTGGISNSTMDFLCKPCAFDPFFILDCGPATPYFSGRCDPATRKISLALSPNTRQINFIKICDTCSLVEFLLYAGTYFLSVPSLGKDSYSFSEDVINPNSRYPIGFGHPISTTWILTKSSASKSQAAKSMPAAPRVPQKQDMPFSGILPLQEKK